MLGMKYKKSKLIFRILSHIWQHPLQQEWGLTQGIWRIWFPQCQMFGQLGVNFSWFNQIGFGYNNNEDVFDLTPGRAIMLNS